MTVASAQLPSVVDRARNHRALLGWPNAASVPVQRGLQ